MTRWGSFSRGVVLMLVCGLMMACAPAVQSAPSLENESVKIVSGEGERVTLSVDLPMTEEEMAHGLMGRTSLPEKYGMLFIFDSDRVAYFWMKDTLIPLDIVFIDREGRIMKIHEWAVPLDETPISSDFQVRAALELAGGTARQYGLNVGDIVLSPMLSQRVAGEGDPEGKK